MSVDVGAYTNPIITGFNPDPSIIRVNDQGFFLITSSFEYFPGIPVYHSKDLIDWKLIGHVLTRKSQLDIRTPEPGGGIWAPSIRFHDGTYYVTAANFDRYRPQQDDRVWPRGFYVHTKDIWDQESWSDPIYFDQVGFDQDLFWDDDGTVYLSSTYRKIERTPGLKLKDFAIHICTVDLSTGNSTSEPKMIRDSTSGIAEGSHIIKKGKYYYLFTAEGGTQSGHCEWISRSEVGPFGPWEYGEKNPLWRNGVHDEVQNTGHADIVEDENGRWWGVFLGVRPVKRDDGWDVSVLGRETFLVPVHWEDDWPVFNNGNKAALQLSAAGLYQHSPSPYWRDDFSASEMALGWYRKNTPTKPDFSLTFNPNYLRLYGSPYTLSTPTCPTLFLRKQKFRKVTWETLLSFHPNSERAEAGTVVWWNYTCYSSIGIRRKDSKRIIRFTPAEGEVIEIPLEHEGSDVKFIIECDEIGYRFGYVEVPTLEVAKSETEATETGESKHEATGTTISNPTATEAATSHSEATETATSKHEATEAVKSEHEATETTTSKHEVTESTDSKPTVPITTSSSKEEEKAMTYISSTPNKVMTRDPPVGMSFTGMMLGLYAFGELQRCLEPADFGYAMFR